MSSTPEPVVTLVDGGDSQTELKNFWLKVNEDVRNTTPVDFKTQELPLARIKKIMKLDDDVKMISAEAPLLFSKAAEMFINELTLRAWIHTEDNKRRTLQRNDIAMAITKFDMFDFLIDIVPREEIKPARTETKTPVVNDQVQYYLQLAQQHQQALQSTASGSPQTIQIVQPGGQVQTISLMQAQSAQTVLQAQNPVGAQQHQIVQLQTSSGGNVNQVLQQAQAAPSNATAAGSNGIQIVQQVIGPNGEIQQVPVQLTPQQHQAIRMHLGSLVQGQQVILQTGGQQGGAGQQQVIQVQQVEQ